MPFHGQKGNKFKMKPVCGKRSRMSIFKKFAFGNFKPLYQLTLKFTYLNFKFYELVSLLHDWQSKDFFQASTREFIGVKHLTLLIII